MGRQKWFDRFLTSEDVAQNRFLSRRRRKNQFFRSTTRRQATAGLGPDAEKSAYDSCSKIKAALASNLILSAYPICVVQYFARKQILSCIIYFEGWSQ